MGASPIVEASTTRSRGSLHTLGFALRAGYVVPLGDHIALWPRVGVAHVRSDAADDEITLRTDLFADARLAWTPDGRWAVTVGPSLSAGITSEKKAPPSFSVGARPEPHPDSNPRLALTAGLTVRLDAEPSSADVDAAPQAPRFMMGVERVLPLARFRIEDGQTEEVLDMGMADTTSRFPVMPRAAFDVVLGDTITLGTAANAGYVRTSSTRLVPGTGPDAFVFGLAPRVGTWLRRSRYLAFWPRVGITWVHASTSRPDLGSTTSFHLGADVDAFVVVLPLESVGIAIGPSVTLPIAGSGRGLVETSPAPEAPWLPRAVNRSEYSYLSVGVSGGIVILL